MLATLLCALVVQRPQTGYAEPVHGLQVLLQLRLHELSSDQYNTGCLSASLI